MEIIFQLLIVDVSYQDTARYVCKVLGASVRDHAELAVYSKSLWDKLNDWTIHCKYVTANG